jgi:hypothetical protein
MSLKQDGQDEIGTDTGNNRMVGVFGSLVRGFALSVLWPVASLVSNTTSVDKFSNSFELIPSKRKSIFNSSLSPKLRA